MVYAEVLYDVATIRKIQGFYLKDPPVASCRVFFYVFSERSFSGKKSHRPALPVTFATINQ